MNTLVRLKSNGFLEQVAQRLMTDANEGWLFDINGNRVGRYELAYEAPDEDDEEEDGE